jgi:hypothetical protein
VNANPSGSRTPSAGRRGRSIVRREFANTTGLPLCGLHSSGRVGGTGPAIRRASSAGGGTRHGMMAWRGALDPRHKRDAQGRHGETDAPRHVDHHVSHPLLSATTSAYADVSGPLSSQKGFRLFGDEPALEAAALRPEAQPGYRDSPHHAASDTEPVQPARGVILAPASRRSQRKGVLAA